MNNHQLQLNIKPGDKVLYRPADLIGIVDTIQEENGYTFVHLVGVEHSFCGHDVFGQVEFVKVTEPKPKPDKEKKLSAVDIKNQYSNMVLMLGQREKFLSQKQTELEDKLSDINFEREQLEDAIRALTELE